MHKIVKGGIALLASLLGSWLGAAVDHNNWWGMPSTALGLLGLLAGYIIVKLLDNFVEG